jgi:acetyl-CoA carboxylase biotin carboxyl carrier protein
VDLKDIKAIIDLMKKNSVTEFELEKQDFKIKLKRGGNGAPLAVLEDPPLLTYAQPTGSIPAQTPTAASAPVPSGELDIKSPMIGTFYRAPSPEAAPYIEVGTEVNPETVVCIIEAMKVMNEITPDKAGEVVSIEVENGEAVEFGQPLFLIRPA